MATRTDVELPACIFLDLGLYRSVTLDLTNYFDRSRNNEQFNFEPLPEDSNFAVEFEDKEKTKLQISVSKDTLDEAIESTDRNFGVDQDDENLILEVDDITEPERTLMLCLTGAVEDKDDDNDSKDIDSKLDGWADPRSILNAERLTLENRLLTQLKKNLPQYRIQPELAPIEDLKNITPDHIRVFFRVVFGTERQVTVGGLTPRFLGFGEVVSTVYLPFARRERGRLYHALGVIADAFRQEHIRTRALIEPKGYLPSLARSGTGQWQRFDYDAGNPDDTKVLNVSAVDIRPDAHRDDSDFNPIMVDQVDQGDLESRLEDQEKQGAFRTALKVLRNVGSDDPYPDGDSPFAWLPRTAETLKSCQIRFRPEIRISGSAAHEGWSIATLHAAFEADRRFAAFETIEE